MAIQTGLVRDLSPRGSQTRVIVRLARVWENKDQTQNMYELGLLFIDQQGNKIEGCLPANRIDKFKERLKESLVYKIESFMVTAARGKYRTVDYPYRVRITQQTRVTEVIPEPEDFPLYAHSAKTFDVLTSRIGNNTVLSDVVGVVTRLTDIIPSKTNQDSRRQIFMKNESNANSLSQ